MTAPLPGAPAGRSSGMDPAPVDSEPGQPGTRLVNRRRTTDDTAGSEELGMTLEETLSKVAELSREELSIVRKRGEEKTAAREHGHDFHEMQHAADRLDHYAHQLRKLHDNEFGGSWRHESRGDAPPS
jgi:hypothetical protein